MKIDLKICTVLSFFIALLTAFTANAQPIALDAKGTQLTLTLPAGSNQPVTAYVLSKGNETQYVTFRVQAPNGTKVTARSTLLGSAKAKDAINKTSGWSNASFMTSSGSESQTLTVGAPQTATRTRSAVIPVRLATSTNYYCGNATITDLDEVIALFTQIQGVTYTRDQLCGLYGYTVGSSGGFGDAGDENSQSNGGYGGGYGGGSVSYGSSTSEAVQVLVRKDTCSVKKNAVYLIRFDLNFSGVSAESISQGSEIYLSATPIVYRDSKASSLKPTSDGKFAPRALFLMATTGGYSGEKLTLVKWNKNKPSLKVLKVEDLVYWRNHTLARVVAEPVLRGGKGVAEIQSNLGVYSVCFRLSKTRQKYNGYS